MDRLEIMYRMQEQLQLRYNNGKGMADFSPEERMAEFRNNTLACTAELFEALDETGWKPWASSNYINREAFKREMTDAWHFFLNLMLHGGMTPADLYADYVVKNHTNHQRITDGYDGVSSKCPSCRRDYNDPGVKCYPDNPNAEQFGKRVGKPGWCQVYGELEARCPACGQTGTVTLASDSGFRRELCDHPFHGDR